MGISIHHISCEQTSVIMDDIYGSAVHIIGIRIPSSGVYRLYINNKYIREDSLLAISVPQFSSTNEDSLGLLAMRLHYNFEQTDGVLAFAVYNHFFVRTNEFNCKIFYEIKYPNVI